MRKIVFVFLFLLMFNLFISTVSAKDYYFPKVTVTINIEENGDFRVVEERTYKFDGSFSWATYTLQKSGFDRIEDFSIKDENGTYTQTQKEENRPSTFVLRDYGNYYEAKFFYTASNTTKTFTISYKVINGIKVYKDVADFYWKLIGTGWDKKTSNFDGYIYLPQKVSNSDDIKVFGHGPLNGVVERINGNGAYYKVTNIPSYTFVEARVIFPSYILKTQNVINENALDRILKEELALAKATEQKKLQTRQGIIGYALIWIAFLAFYLYIFFRFGKEPIPKREIIYVRDIPEDLPPAIVGYLMRFETVTAEDLAATILYLIKKGYIALEIKEVERNYLLFKKKEKVTYFYKTEKNPSELKGHLKLAYDFLFNIVSQGNNFTSTDEIKALSTKRSKVGRDFFMNFQRIVQKEGRERNYFENRVKIFLIYFGVFALAWVLSFFLITNKGLTFLLLFNYLFIVIFGLLSLTLKKRTEIGAEAYAEWNGLKKFLNDFSNLKDYAPDSIVVWENYLVYATTFGIADKVIKYMEMNIDKIPQEEFSKSYFFAHGFSNQTFDTSFARAITSSLNDIINSINTSVSASTGSGGGFSGGGGGGGGGSGGSAG